MMSGPMYVPPKHFVLEEFLPPTIVRKQGTAGKNRGWWIMDERALWTTYQLRMRFGPVIINDYLFGGKNKERGFRVWNTKTGALFSQHKYGRAIDCVFEDISVEEVSDDIISRPFDLAYKYITAIEVGCAWLHFDFRANRKNELGLMVIDPRSPVPRYVGRK